MLPVALQRVSTPIDLQIHTTAAAARKCAATFKEAAPERRACVPDGVLICSTVSDADLL